MLILAQILIGIVLLAIGGEALVRGAVALARRLNFSPLFIGITLVGFGSSMPEFITSLRAASIGAPGITIGNVVGSNISNILLIAGLAAIIMPISINPAAFRRDAPALVAATLVAAIVVLVGELGRPAGVLMVALLLAYLYATYLSERRAQTDAARLHIAEAEALGLPRPAALTFQLGLTAIGFAALLGGATVLVDGALAAAETFGLSETVIGVTVVALGTSMPELAVSAVAAYRRQGDLAIGNVIGSNIFNLLGVLGFTALIRPIAVPAEAARIDLWVMLAVTALLVAFSMSGWRLSRREGVVLLAGYVTYVGARVLL